MLRPHFLLFAALFAALSSSGFAKDKKTSLELCPAPVQAVVRQYSAAATLEEIEINKDSGADVYEAKFLAKDGQRVKVMLSPDGKVLGSETKKAKKDK